MDWGLIAKQASLVMGQEWVPKATHLCDFVRMWSGGADGRIIRELETYEKQLKVKRNIHPHDLAGFSALESLGLEAPHWVPSMVKAMLVSPNVDSLQYATLFNSGDMSSLQGAGKNRSHAKHASEWIGAADSFLKAYSSSISTVDQLRLVSEFGVRVVMHVHQKKAATRQSFDSVEAIAAIFYADAKAIDSKLPAWGKLKVVVPPKAKTMTGLRELCSDGRIPDTELAGKGFKVGAKVTDGTVTGTVHTLNQNETSITLEIDKKVIEMSRQQFMSEYTVVKEVLATTWSVGSYPDPTNYVELMVDIFKGGVKAAVLDLYVKMSTDNMVLIQEKPTTKVFATGAIKARKLKLLPLSNNIAVVPANKVSGGEVLGIAFTTASGVPMTVVARQQLTFPHASTVTGCAHKNVEPFVVAYWAMSETHEFPKTNCERTEQIVTVRGQQFRIPMITNTIDLDKGAELIVPKRSDAEEIPEPATKRRKSEGASNNGKSKGKGKGKGGSKK